MIHSIGQFSFLIAHSSTEGYCTSINGKIQVAKDITGTRSGVSMRGWKGLNVIAWLKLCSFFFTCITHVPPVKKGRVSTLRFKLPFLLFWQFPEDILDLGVELNLKKTLPLFSVIQINLKGRCSLFLKKEEWVVQKTSRQHIHCFRNILSSINAKKQNNEPNKWHSK